MDRENKATIYVGADRSQALAVRVLEHSIQRHASLRAEIIPMLDLPIPSPKDPKNSPRTGFSLSRFCIPKLAGYKGKAVYMDADMLVLKDVKSLWDIAFDGARVVIQKEIKYNEETTKKEGAPTKRTKQCSVMLMDCERLDWDIDKIITEMDDGIYDYEKLMYDLVILQEKDIKYGIPFEWNSLEHYDDATCLIHYTDMYTQPWTSCKNKNGHLWLQEVRLMLRDRALTIGEIEHEIELGYFRPSLIRDVKYGGYIPRVLESVFARVNASYDRSKAYIPHKEVYAAKKKRLAARDIHRRSRAS
jgi:lipopolysaccharide biosynthesis glycosyltransferase